LKGEADRLQSTPSSVREGCKARDLRAGDISNFKTHQLNKAVSMKESGQIDEEGK